MLYAVLIAICAASTPVAECDSATALHWIAAPDPQIMSACGVHGQQYAAQSRLVAGDTYVKVFCRPVDRATRVDRR